MQLLIDLDEEYVNAIDKIKFLVGGRIDRKLQLAIIEAIKNGKVLDQEPCNKYIKEIDHLRKYIYKLETQIVEQEPRWIPVSERLPDTDDEFLCWYEYYHWSQGKVLPEYGVGRYLRVTSSWSGEVASGRDVRVIAWMPLPKPYEPQESEET